MKLSSVISYATAAVLAAQAFVLPQQQLGAEAHSYVVCTDTRSDGSCHGYPRDFIIHDMIQDGYTYRPGTTGIACDPKYQNRTNPITDSYSAKYPMAVASAGSTLRVQWPARNHAPANLPGRTLEIYWMPQANLAADPTQAQLDMHTLAKLPFGDEANGASACAPGTSNDRLCSGSFKIPASTSPGIYTFQWWWQFNPGEFYATCFEVNVGGMSTGAGASNSTSSTTTGSTAGNVTTPTGSASSTGSTTGGSTSGNSTTTSLTATIAGSTAGSTTGSTAGSSTGSIAAGNSTSTGQTSTKKRKCSRKKCNAEGEQCGGTGFTGSQCCKGKAKCVAVSDSYSKCVATKSFRF